jgi:hypothetical protein
MLPECLYLNLTQGLSSQYTNSLVRILSRLLERMRKDSVYKCRRLEVSEPHFNYAQSLVFTIGLPPSVMDGLGLLPLFGCKRM